jgi:DNA repair photolyase
MPPRPIALNPENSAPHRGRGALTNITGRYEKTSREKEADGWDSAPEPQSLATSITEEVAKSVISYNTSPDISFDRTVNPYRGCEHGCVYCYARPNHAFVGLSPGLDFESRLFVKSNAIEKLSEELAHPGYKPATLMLSGVTDCYQPIERTHRLTRRVLETMLAWHHPVAITTKSALVLRDIDVLQELAKLRLVKIALSITTLDPRLARRLEPRATTPAKRLAAIEGLAKAGVPTSVMVAPIIPGLTDTEIEAIISAAATAGARSAGYVLLRLPLELKALMQEWLHTHTPARASHVWRLLTDTHNGAVYQSQFGLRQRGSGPYAQLIAQRFRMALRRNHLQAPRFDLDTTLFRKPPTAGDQLPLF